MSQTARTWAIGHAPPRIDLLGDKHRRPESAQHIIEFPGGAIEVTRTSDGDYWAHIIVNRRPGFADGSTRETARGDVIASRLACDAGVLDLPDDGSVEQVAVLIRAVGR